MREDNFTPAELRAQFAVRAALFGIEEDGGKGDREEIIRAAVNYGHVKRLTRAEIEHALDTPPAKLIRGTT